MLTRCMAYPMACPYLLYVDLLFCSCTLSQLFIRDHCGKPLSRAEALGVSVSVAMVDCNAQLIIVFSSDGFAAK